MFVSETTRNPIGAAFRVPGYISNRYPAQFTNNDPGDMNTEDKGSYPSALTNIMSSKYPTKEPSTVLVFGDSNRDLGGFTRAITSGDPSEIPSDEATKDISQVPIINPPNVPSENPTKYYSHVTK